MSGPQPSPSPQPSPTPGRTPADIVVDFLGAWARYDVDAVLDLVTEDLPSANPPGASASGISWYDV